MVQPEFSGKGRWGEHVFMPRKNCVAAQSREHTCSRLVNVANCLFHRLASVHDATFALSKTMTALKTARGFLRHLHTEH